MITSTAGVRRKVRKSSKRSTSIVLLYLSFLNLSLVTDSFVFNCNNKRRYYYDTQLKIKASSTTTMKGGGIPLIPSGDRLLFDPAFHGLVVDDGNFNRRLTEGINYFPTKGMEIVTSPMIDDENYKSKDSKEKNHIRKRRNIGMEIFYDSLKEDSNIIMMNKAESVATSRKKEENDSLPRRTMTVITPSTGVPQGGDSFRAYLDNPMERKDWYSKSPQKQKIITNESTIIKKNDDDDNDDDEVKTDDTRPKFLVQQQDYRHQQQEQEQKQIPDLKRIRHQQRQREQTYYWWENTISSSSFFTDW